jgi:hypothetical protein
MRKIGLIAFLAVLVGGALLLGLKAKAGEKRITESSPPGSEIKGVVKEARDSGGYTYVQVAQGKKEVWVALPLIEVKEGDEIEVDTVHALVMRNFYSRSLNRTFPEILFASRAKVKGVWLPHEKGEHGGIPTMAPSFNPHGTSKMKGHPDGFPHGGYRVAELYEKAKTLNGYEVMVRGKVVKFLPNIMGRNWLHIADGSGKDVKAEVTITTQKEVKPGDLVIVKGKLSANKDFGYGYFYKVIIEDASVMVEKGN